MLVMNEHPWVWEAQTLEPWTTPLRADLRGWEDSSAENIHKEPWTLIPCAKEETGWHAQRTTATRTHHSTKTGNHQLGDGSSSSVPRHIAKLSKLGENLPEQWRSGSRCKRHTQYDAHCPVFLGVLGRVACLMRSVLPFCIHQLSWQS